MKEKNTVFLKDRRFAAAAFIVTAVMILITISAGICDQMTGSNLIAGILLAVSAGVFLLLNFSYGKILSLLAYLILPAASFAALEYYSHVLSDLSGMIILLNLLFFYLLYGLAAFLLGNIRWGFIIATCIPMLFGLTNYFVVAFRGHPIVPWDFLSLTTAVSVVDNYEFTITWKQAYVLLAYVWIMVLAAKSHVKFIRKPVRFSAAAVFLLLMIGYLGGIQKNSVQSYFGMDTTLFTLNVLYRNNGIAAAFLGNLRFLNLEEPDGYSAEYVQKLEEELTAEEEPVKQYPNIIVVMNEAFSDLSVWGEFATSEEVMPFFKLMQQEGIGGELYVSVKGGNTANTELEFLTGNTMAFLPGGSVPYQQYITGETPTMATYLKSLGYRTLAIHPYNRSGWDRDKVYEYFAFDEFLDIQSFDNPHRMRGYVSDRAAYNKIIEQYQYKADDERLFVFEVTMQNHGGYSKETPDFESYVTLPEVTSKTTSILATEKYLTLMNESDRALQDFISYFEQQDEPVVVLMFGDHQPSDYITNVIRRICGIDEPETLEEIQQGYRVPFMIWSNQGLDPTWYDGISVNYLGGILMETAGIPMTGYQKFLSNLQETLPVITGNVLRDSEGTFYPLDSENYTDELNEYKILQYNHMVDTKNRIDSFFGG